jgi:hypothetical protein
MGILHMHKWEVVVEFEDCDKITYLRIFSG